MTNDGSNGLDEQIVQARRAELEVFDLMKAATSDRRKLEERAGRQDDKMDPPWVEFETLTPDEWWDRGASYIRREYYGDINDHAREIISEFQHDQGGDDLHDRIHEAVDSTAWCIYTHRAMKVMWVSENESHALEEGLVELEGDSIPWSALAYWAMQQDIHEAIDRLGPDLGFDPLEPLECPECSESWSDHTFDEDDEAVCPSEEDEDDEEESDDSDPA